jgi:hypothetical protein
MRLTEPCQLNHIIKARHNFKATKTTKSKGARPYGFFGLGNLNFPFP